MAQTSSVKPNTTAQTEQQTSVFFLKVSTSLRDVPGTGISSMRWMAWPGKLSIIPGGAYMIS